MLGTATTALGFPSGDEGAVIKKRSMRLYPPTQVGAAGAVERGEAAQLAEMIRELWDFR